MHKPEFCPLKRAAQLAPNAIAFRSKESALSFAELDKKTTQTMQELQSLGLKEKEIVALHLPADLSFYTLLFASLRIGALICPLNLRLPPLSLALHLSQLSPKLLFTAAGVEIRSSTPLDLPSSSLLIFTSGSTGSPKLAVISLINMIANATSATAHLDLRPGDGWLLSLPLHHVGGLSILFRCLLSTATLITDPSDQNISHLSYVPAQLYKSWPIYPHLRCLLLGGSSFGEIPGELPITISYGMTETASLILGQKYPRQKNGFWYLGFPLKGKEIKLNKEGEILVRGDSLFCGYLEKSALITPFDEEGWFATKDLGHFDPEEGFAIIGRKDNQFISGGENIQPEEIEKELICYPGIFDAVVVPVENPHFGFRPIAYLRTINTNIDPTDVLRFLRERLPKYKLPDALFILNESKESPLKTQRKQIFEIAKTNSSNPAIFRSQSFYNEVDKTSSGQKKTAPL